MRIHFVILFFSIAIFGVGQNLPEQLNRFGDNILLNKNDTSCLNISGEWLGEEIQYDPTQSFIKYKFKVKFDLKQQGNVITGTTFIRDKFRGSYGYMKIRGVIVGSKFHFEEYDVVGEKFYEKNVVWCLRAGVLSIGNNGDIYSMIGLDYDGYTSAEYEKCTDYVKMSVTRSIKYSSKEAKNENKNYSNVLQVSFYPNPTNGIVNIKYRLDSNSKTRIDVFDLVGKQIAKVLIDERPFGDYESKIDLTNTVPGVYLVRIITENVITTAQVIRTE